MTGRGKKKNDELDETFGKLVGIQGAFPIVALTFAG
jgi:hypothetical protein